MIKVCFTKKNGKYTSLSITGHANTDVFGKDLVCAEASAIAFGTCNALNELTNNENINISKNKIDIQINDESEMENIILDVCRIQLATIEYSHPTAIEIKITEE